MDPVRRVGVFGGAFDPPHTAHCELARTALEQLNLDVLHIIPTGHAWHKARILSPAEHRLAMCRLAFGAMPRVRLDERELHREGPSYTADTLRELQREYPGALLYLVLGADQLLAFKTWVRWQEVLALATLAAANRTPQSGAIADAANTDEADLSGIDFPFVQLNMPLRNISATAVRARAGQAGDASRALAVLVPEAVASYISQHSLYQPPK